MHEGHRRYPLAEVRLANLRVGYAQHRWRVRLFLAPDAVLKVADDLNLSDGRQCGENAQRPDLYSSESAALSEAR
jgi:hypothetical protein